MNALERSTIANRVANYIVDHLLVEPMTAARALHSKKLQKTRFQMASTST
jgi:hypothetical protein